MAPKQKIPFSQHKRMASFDVSRQTKCNDILSHDDGKNMFYIHWNSRSHRKRRFHPVSIDSEQQYKPETSFKFFKFEWSNLSWWVPFLFTLGSLVWLVNGYFSMWPMRDHYLQVQASSWTAFLGGLIFIFGAYTAFLEVINRPSHVHLRTKLDTNDEKPNPSDFYAHHSHEVCNHRDQPKQFNWFKVETGNWGWWLNLLQMFGALVFYIACAFGLFFIFIQDSSLRYQWFWLPQMIGALFFILSSLMAMLEVQEKFYRPAWSKIGWHAAFYNLLGAIGFYLCAYYGAYYHQEALIYWGSDFSTFWGSIGFLIASYLMLLEVINP